MMEKQAIDAPALIQAALDEHRKVLDRFAQAGTAQQVAAAGETLADAFSKGHKLLVCGNGGSLAQAIHLAEELTGRFKVDRPALPAIALADPGHLSCVANDYGYRHVFARAVEALGQRGDVLLCLTTSGDSTNLLEAAAVADRKGMLVMALTGKDGGKLAHQCDLEIRVPHDGFSDRIQEIHQIVLHGLIQVVEHTLFPMAAR